MENVTGMVKGTFKGKFIEIMQTLKGMNYQVKCKQMNSKYYGVPQSRERLIFIGVRNDLKKVPVYPKPSKELSM
jgi:Site-specific DNA methylase